MTVITETPTVTELTHTEERVQYAVGDCCAVHLACGDTEALNIYDEDEDDAILHPLATFGDYAGNVVAVAYYDGGGYWDCGVCQEVNIGRGVVFEGDRIQH